MDCLLILCYFTKMHNFLHRGFTPFNKFISIWYFYIIKHGISIFYLSLVCRKAIDFLLTLYWAILIDLCILFNLLSALSHYTQTMVSYIPLKSLNFKNVPVYLYVCMLGCMHIGMCVNVYAFWITAVTRTTRTMNRRAAPGHPSLYLKGNLPLSPLFVVGVW